MKDSSKASNEQLKFAAVLQFLSVVGFLYLLIGFVLYSSGILPSFIEPDLLVSYWHLPLNEFLSKTGMPTGWGWFVLLNYADMISFSGIVFLALVSTVSCIIVLPSYFKKRDIFAYVILLQIIILILAASGFFSMGH